MSPLDEYRKKRDFQKTPEPPGGTRRRSQRSFVVHRHEARRLHYDLRLELEGVLKSWAIPKGFSYVPSDKRLAVRTEDHPMEYLEFHGVIPQGEYGAGTMTIWDSGEFELLGSERGRNPLEAGKLEIVLRGQRLRGEWHLVKTSRGENEWLLFKSKDVYARKEHELNIPFNFAVAKRKKSPRLRRWMQPAATGPAFSHSKWVFELCFDGIRAFAAGQDGIFELKTDKSRGPKDLEDRCPEVLHSLSRVRAENFLLDGVLVALDENERPCKTTLLRRLEQTDPGGICFYAFDLLYCEEFDLRSLPLLARKQALRWILPKLPAVLFVDHVEHEGKKLFRLAESGGLGRIIAKRADSGYSPGDSRSWIEIPIGHSNKNASESLRRALKTATSKSGVSRFQYRNRNKVFWPEEGYTKGDLLEYYEQIADTLLPYLRDRPLHLNRFPNGIEGKSFYQKNVPDLPDWIDTERVPSGRSGTTQYIVCNDRETLLYLINLASIDLHPWLSRRGCQDSPDWAVLDLDPKKASFADVVKLARFLGKVLRGIGLRPLLKTSGATGLHIYVPLVEGYSYEHSRMFCEALARLAVREYPGVATVDRVIEQRDRKVYVDYLQNRKGQTLVPPYAVRPVPGASVSAPLDWDELDSDLHIRNFTIKTMQDRLARCGDLFQPALSDRQDLLPAIEAMQKNFGANKGDSH